MCCAGINDQCGLSIFFSKLIARLPYPLFEMLLIHPTFFLCSITTRKFLDMFEASWVVRFANDKHWEYITVHICSSQTGRSYFAMLASSAFFIFEMESFLRVRPSKTDQSRRDYRFRFSNIFLK